MLYIKYQEKHVKVDNTPVKVNKFLFFGSNIIFGTKYRKKISENAHSNVKIRIKLII